MDIRRKGSHTWDICDPAQKIPPAEDQQPSCCCISPGFSQYLKPTRRSRRCLSPGPAKYGGYIEEAPVFLHALASTWALETSCSRLPLRFLHGDVRKVWHCSANTPPRIPILCTTLSDEQTFNNH
ncbi:hypothetical protein VTI74DRAFT_1770 [Chaetomium olivicolor]